MDIILLNEALIGPSFNMIESYDDQKNLYLDVNSFETISSWTESFEDLACLDGSVQPYRVYIFQNPVAAGDYQYTFKR